MKIKHLLLSLLSLSLIGCSNQSDVNPSPDSSEKNNELDSNTKKDDKSDDKKDDGKKDDDKKDDGKKDDDKKEDEKIDPTITNTGWPTSIWKDMLKYLGGSGIPFIDLGKPSLMYGSWQGNESNVYGYHETYYEIATGLDDFEENTLTNFETTYSNADWVVEKNDDSATATLESKHLKVELKKSLDDTDLGSYVYLNVYYDEPYDPTTITAWTDEINDNFNTYVHGHSIPFIYMGTTNLYSFASSNNSNTALTIRSENGSWDDRIITAAKTKLGDEWNCSETDGTYSKILTAVKTFDSDSCKITLTLKAMETKTKNANKPELIISMEEGYNSTGYTNPDEWDKNYKWQFHDHDIPAIYLGTKNPTMKKYDYNRYMTFTGKKKTWDDRILTDAKTVLKAADWEYETITVSEHEGLIAYKEFTDGCRLIIQIGQEGAYTPTPVMYLSIEEPLDLSTDTDWDADTKKAITDALGTDVTIPYVDLGDHNLTVTWKANARRLEITPNKVTEYNSGPALKAVDIFTKAHWTITKKGWDGYKGYGMNATFTATNGDVYTAAIDASNYYPARLIITCKEDFSVPASGTAWPDSVLSDMKTNLFGYTLPYIYMGTKKPATSWDSSSMELTIIGGFWNDQIMTLFKTALTNDTTTSWTIDDERTKYCVAIGENTTLGYKFTAILTTDSVYGTSKIVISYKKMDSTTTTGSWSDTILTAMKSKMDNHTAPYINLGTSSPTAKDFDDSYQKMEIRGESGTWTDTTYDSAKKNLAADGFTVQDTTKSSVRYIMGYKRFNDGCAMRIEVYHYVYEDDDEDDPIYIDYPLMKVFYGKSYTANSSTSWSTTNQAVLDSYFGTASGSYKLPYLDTGATEMTASYDAKKNYVELKLSPTTKTNSLTIILNMMNTLKAADSDWEFSFKPDCDNYHMVNGTLIRSDNSIIQATLYSYPGSTTYIDLTYTAPSTSTTND